ncbi:MAG: transporter substrate-binding domain-containing protein [Candidatus Eremiobacteraeota bacterium]|nr:transporter substrate-binding domain-containing protein [Candidatus Eremiobacteraeota bacterium]
MGCLWFRRCFAFVAAAALLGNGCSAPAGHGAAGGPNGGVAATGMDLLRTVRQRGRLVVSADADYAPQSYKGADGVWRGFDVDVAREIARRLSLRAQFMDVNFDAITGGNWNGRWDVNVNSMTATHERERVLYFSRPYYYVPAAFVVHKLSQMQSINDLSGRRVGVGTATTYQEYLEGRLGLSGDRIVHAAPQARAVPYDTDQLALQDLALGDGVRLDAALTSGLFARYQIKHGQPLRLLGDPVFFEASAVAIDRHSALDATSLYRAVDRAIADMHKDGTLRRLSVQYFGIDASHRQ